MKILDSVRRPFVWLALLFVGACGGVADETSDETTTATTTGPLYAATMKLWGNTNIPVCWETAGSETEKTWVRNSILRTWEQESAVVFTGWGTCAQYSTGIRIAVADDFWPSVVAFGRDLNGVPGGMRLSFGFTARDANGVYGFSGCWGSARQKCIESIAVHEFGHALGFMHEQNRGDTPSTCTTTPAGGGTEAYGPWDLMSVMNYCNPAFNNDGKLSSTDIAGVVHFYGAPRDTLLLNAGYAQCAQTTSMVAMDNFTYLAVAPCQPNRLTTPQNYQRWMLTHQRTIRHSGSGRCLDASLNGGTRAFVLDCNGGSSQRWTLGANGELKQESTGRCLEVASTFLGNELLASPCNGSANQRWARTATPLKLFGSDRCIDAPSGDVARMAACSPAASQQWTLHADGTMRNLATGRCLEATSTAVLSSPCTGVTGQKWKFTSWGHLSLSTLYTNRCLAVPAGGDTILPRGCASAIDQRWLTH